MVKRRTFSREFKFAVVKKVVKQGLSYAAVARGLGVDANQIRKWKQSFEKDGSFQTEVTGSGSLEPRNSNVARNSVYFLQAADRSGFAKTVDSSPTYVALTASGRGRSGANESWEKLLGYAFWVRSRGLAAYR